MKRFTLFVLVCLFLMAVLPVFADDPDFEIQDGVLAAYTGTDTNVTIPDTAVFTAPNVNDSFLD